MQRYRGPWRVIFIGIYASTARFYAGVSLKLPLGEAGQNGRWMEGGFARGRDLSLFITR